jgi:polysaccharide export outer membrane protein
MHPQVSNMRELKDPVNRYFMVTDRYLVFEKSGVLGGRGLGFWQLPTEFTKASPTPPPPSGVVVKSNSYHRVVSGLLLIALSGLLLGPVVLLGQAPTPSQANRGTSVAVAMASPAQPPAPSGNNPNDDSFVIGNDDLLAINVWKEPDFSQKIQVRSDGKISLPLLGEIQATGLTPLQLERDLTAKLRNYITKPEVTVMVEQINSKKFNILGQVGKPGSYSLALAPTIVDAIAIAGGPRDFAKQKSIYILRQNPGGGQTRIAFNYKDFLKGKNQNVKLEPHDTVVVP